MAVSPGSRRTLIGRNIVSIRRIATSLGVLGLAALLITSVSQGAGADQEASGNQETVARQGAGGSQGASASFARTLNFTNALDTLTPVDLAPPGPSAGDAFYVFSHTVSGNVSGRTSASCVVATVLAPGVKQCEVDFFLTQGIITTRGLTNSVGAVVALVVIGGTGSYSGVVGDGTLTPTPTGSTVTLRVTGISRQLSSDVCSERARAGTATRAC